MTVIAAVFILAGSGFVVLAAVGLLRFPELYTRLHAAAKAGPIGVGLILAGAAFASEDLGIAIRCTLGLAFLILMSPISAHLLARAALLTSSAPLNISSIKNIDDSRQA